MSLKSNIFPESCLLCGKIIDNSQLFKNNAHEKCNEAKEKDRAFYRFLNESNNFLMNSHDNNFY